MRYTGKRTGKVTDPFYLTPEWKADRLAVLRRDNYTCVMCGADVRGKGKSRVDHIKPRRTHPHLARDHSNLRTLCSTCDNQRHAGRGHEPMGTDATGQPLDPTHWWNQRGKPP